MRFCGKCLRFVFRAMVAVALLIAGVSPAFAQEVAPAETESAAPDTGPSQAAPASEPGPADDSSPTDQETPEASTEPASGTAADAEPAGVVGEGDRVDHPGEFLARPLAVRGHRGAERLDLRLVLDVADQHRGVADELAELVAAFFAPHRVDNPAVGLDQQPRDVPRDRLAVGDPRHEDRLAGELEEVSGHEGSDEVGRMKDEDELKDTALATTHSSFIVHPSPFTSATVQANSQRAASLPVRSLVTLPFM
jgi:hypothetical protein